MQSRTIDVPQEIPKRGIMQYVHAEAERMEKRYRCGMDEDDRTTFEQYAESWLTRQTHYKPSTLAGYKRQLEVVYPYIGGVTLNKLRPLILEEMCAELRKRKNRRGEPVCEATVHKYLETVSAVLEDAKRNDILLYNPTILPIGCGVFGWKRRCSASPPNSRCRAEKKVQRVPAEFEMRKLMQCILQEPLLYRVFYLTAITTGMRRGELCALRWNDLHGGGVVTVQHSRSSVLGQGIVESSTKNHRARTVVIPELVHDYMGELFLEQARAGRVIHPDDYIFSTVDGPVHPDSFTRRLRRIYQKNDFPPDYHLHTLRHFFATYLLQNNTSKQVAAELLGHADTSFLERTYCHPQLESKQQAASVLAEWIQPAEDEAWTREQAQMKTDSAG